MERERTGGERGTEGGRERKKGRGREVKAWGKKLRMERRVGGRKKEDEKLRMERQLKTKLKTKAEDEFEDEFEDES